MREGRLEKTEEESLKEEDGYQKLRELKHEVEKNRPDLIMNKVPKGELKLFKELAKQEFRGDYGMTLKFLVMHFLDDIKLNNCLIRIDRLETEFLNKNKDDTKSTDHIKALDGSILK